VKSAGCIRKQEISLLTDDRSGIFYFVLVRGQKLSQFSDQGGYLMLKKISGLVVLTLLVAMTAFAQPPQPQPGGMAPPKTHLKIGDKAPDFMLTATDDSKVKLSSFQKQKKTVVLAFYPKAFTGG
jgi:hypothetical protein